MSQEMSFGQMADDESMPTGMVSRRKAGGSVEIGILKGGDQEINDSHKGLRYMIDLSGGLTSFIDAAKESSKAKGIDVTVLVKMENAGMKYEAVLAIAASGADLSRIDEALESELEGSLSMKDIEAALLNGTLDQLLDS